MLTDDLGSVRTAITNQAGAATVVGYVGYGPFGFLQYHAGQTGTNKGYTGQYTDPLSGLDYYVARYYDPVVGLFLSADTVQSSRQGFDPYAYVGNNALQLAMILGGPEFDATGAGGDGLAALAPTALDKTEVLLDTNAVLNYKRIISAGLLDLSTEEPVISQTVKNELIDIVARKGRYMLDIVDSLRIVPDAGSEETKAALLAFLESLGPVKQQGLAQDLEIAATAIDTGRPLITGEAVMSREVESIVPGLVRRFLP